MLFTLLQADVLDAVQASPVPQEMSYSLIDMAMKGGWLMAVLLLLSVIAIYIFGKKLVQIGRASKVDNNFIDDIRDYIHDGKTKSAITLCSKYDNPTARLVETAVENTGNLEVARLEKGLPFLAAIAGGAPMIGFLGTVMGMVRAFFNMANAGNNIDITLLSGGIYEAMITTVGGLIVGILAYFGYNYLTSRISDVVFTMENATIGFMDVLNDPESAAIVKPEE